MAMEEKELSLSSVSRLRTALLLVGTAIGYLSLLPEQLALAYSMLMVSICMSVYGCYLWARLKGRHWIWMVFGLLAPAGFLALALLKNKHQEPPKPQA
ncbi:MAG: hypothetical protein ABSD79_01200 [Dehalococcoidales bacterium]|jgi:hypothetical protein